MHYHHKLWDTLNTFQWKHVCVRVLLCALKGQKIQNTSAGIGYSLYIHLYDMNNTHLAF